MRQFGFTPLSIILSHLWGHRDEKLIEPSSYDKGLFPEEPDEGKLSCSVWEWRRGEQLPRRPKLGSGLFDTCAYPRFHRLFKSFLRKTSNFIQDGFSCFLKSVAVLIFN